MSKRAKNGFTLIETVVVSLLLAILALGIFALFSMYADSSRGMNANFQMQRRYQALMDDINRHVREANYVFTQAEYMNANFLLETADSTASKTIVLTDKDRQPKRAYSVNKNYVEVSDYTENWKPFTIDGDTLWLAPSPAPNTFRLRSNRMHVTADITLRLVVNRDTVDLNVEGGAFQCRL